MMVTKKTSICSFTEESKNEIKQYKKEKKLMLGAMVEFGIPWVLTRLTLFAIILVLLRKV